jgi:hypothetical protein
MRAANTMAGKSGNTAEVSAQLTAEMENLLQTCGVYT